MLKIRFILFFTAIIGWCGFNAQSLNSSPYTRYGLGDQVKLSSTPFIGMGGASISLANFRYINFSNPATYGTVLRYNPIFDAGFMGKTSHLKTDLNTLNSTTVALRNFSLLMPLSKKTGFVFGLMPYSNTGYEITNYEDNAGDTITYSFKGAGSVNRLLFGLGQQIINKGDSIRFSAGVNASYLFGTLEKSRTVAFQDASYYNTKLLNKSIVRGFVFDVGLHYYEKISNKLTFQLGATAKLGSEVKGFQDFYAYNFKYSADGVTELGKDTVNYYEDSEGIFNLPKGFGIGASVTLDRKITLSAQYEAQNWQSYSETFDSIEYNPTELTQNYRFSYGMEFIPFIEESSKNSSAIKLSTYRVGFHHGTTPYFLEDTHLKQYGISFGISIPLISSNSTSTVSMAFELGKMGTTQNGLIEDNYFNFNLGFSLSPHARFDRWFKKRLYD